ncbi:hypothetical protein RGQ15_14425 [Paracoccus sp. MBLB3053]|uniref:Uncharacterized protein n=1 Tax=Paracoccus aurantius TaxID=3073814 RepID=A0ABU2HUM4_9RHOB|nr:hypothetical protein [Paracoccus sp. MBLB3053]MDS9468758.1 hypothetical protein [Paracoccus sp. MBLB3053]
MGRTALSLPPLPGHLALAAVPAREAQLVRWFGLPCRCEPWSGAVTTLRGVAAWQLDLDCRKMPRAVDQPATAARLACCGTIRHGLAAEIMQAVGVKRVADLIATRLPRRAAA